jgi:putative ABC transport system permease protein
MLPLKSAIKSLRRSPGFATVSILSLALALGLVAAVFGIVDALRNPVTATADPERLVEVRMKGEGAAGRISAADHIEALERNVRSSQGMAYATFARGDVLMSRDIRVTGMGLRVGGNWFAVHGVRPVAGRLFNASMADEDAVASVVISEGIWRSLFDAEPQLDRIALSVESETDTRRVQVVGVVPDAFAAETGYNYWLALRSDLKTVFATERYVLVRLRLRTDATLDSLRVDLKAVTEYLTSVHGKGRTDFIYYGEPLTRDPLRMNEMIWLLVGTAFAVLIVACANLANLVLARGLAKQRDMAVRLSLGARRRDIVNGVLAECLVIALAGAALGILSTTWAWDLIRATMPERIPTGGFAVEMNWRVVAMSSGAAAAAALLFGLFPALRLSDVKLAEHIKETSGSNTARRRNRFPVLVIGQVALSLAMLTGVALLLRASQQVKAFSFGFDPARLLSVYVSGARSDTSQASRLALASAAQTRLRAYPEVEAVAWRSGVSTTRAPVFTGERSGGATRERPLRGYNYVSPNYLRTVGIPIIRGRDFADRDEFSEGVLIVDSVTALKIWGSEDPIGKLAKFGFTDRVQPWFRVIGVSGSVRSDLPRHDGEEAEPQIYMVGKTAFTSPTEAGIRPLTARIPIRSFIVRAKARDIPRLRATIPRDIQTVLPRRGGVNVYGFDDRRQELIKMQRMLATIFGAFGFLSLTLCALGLYSVLSYTVTQRMREHGIRVALGATSRRIFLDVLHDGAILVVAGTGLGGFVTFWTNKFVDPYIGMMFYIDVWALVAAEFVLVAVAMLAMMRPALRATRTDPVEVLRAA